MTSAGGRISAGVGANLIGQHAQDRNQEATCYVGNLDEQVSEELLWELFTQAGPVNNVYVPKDRVTTKHKGHAFIEFKGEEDADYAIKVLNMIKVFGKPIRVNKASQEKRALDVGANLFIGNLDPDVDEKMLYDTFSAFGVITGTPKIMRDPDSGISKGFGFVSFDNFESSDAAIDAMHGQFLMNRSISVQYAFKKDTNERHGTPEERLMAQNYRLAAINSSRPHTLFASGPSGTAPAAQPPAMHGGQAPAMPSGMPQMPGPPPMAPMQMAAQQPSAPPSMPPMAGGGPALLTLPLPSAAPPRPPPWQAQLPYGASQPPPWATAGPPQSQPPYPPAAQAPPPWLQPPPRYPPPAMPPPPQLAPPPQMYGGGMPPPMSAPPPPPGFAARPPPAAPPPPAPPPHA
eukprot:jgi/Ulvmu1/8030/UM004_0267.1